LWCGVKGKSIDEITYLAPASPPGQEPTREPGVVTDGPEPATREPGVMTGGPEPPAPTHGCGEEIAAALKELVELAKQPPAGSKLLTIEQAAERLNVGRATLAVWVTRGKVPHTRLADGKHIRFTEEHLTHIIATGEHGMVTPSDEIQAVREGGRQRFGAAGRHAAKSAGTDAGRQATAARGRIQL
jgi:excisionase family DNA binding protein